MTTTVARTFAGRPPRHQASRWLRTQGLTQADVARAVGRLPGTVASWFRDTAFPLPLFDGIETLLGTEAREEFTRLFGDPKPPWRPADSHLPALVLARRTPPTRWLFDRGIGPIDLARVLGVSTSQISHWCRGFRKAPPEFFAAVEFKVGFPAVREFEALVAAGK